MTGLSRRTFLRYAGGGLGAVAFAGPIAVACGGNGEGEESDGGVRLSAVMWGEPYIGPSREIGAAWEESTGNQITWQLHEGGSAGVLAKIEAGWPNPGIDMTAVWNPVFSTQIREGWLEPIDTSLVPNLADISDELIMKGPDGLPMTVPMSVSGIFWGYREDIVPKPLESVTDLLDDEFRGQIAMPSPLDHTGLTMVSLALERGGNEFEIESGFDFVKELAERGNIGRVLSSEVDMINSLTSGETSVSFWNIAGWNAVAENFEISILNRAESPGALGFLFAEGWSVLKGPNSATAMDLVNHFVSPENNHTYNNALALGPTNANAEPVEASSRYLYATPEEINEFGYIADYEHLSAEVEGWNSRWESEVVPLL